MIIEPYLFFDGRCDEAIEFYKKALGAKVTMLSRFKDSPNPMGPPEMAEKVMHANLLIGESHLLVSDGRCGGKPAFEGMALSIVVKTIDEAERTFAALAEGGKIQMPMAESFWSARFGMTADRFGVSWMVMVEMK